MKKYVLVLSIIVCMSIGTAGVSFAGDITLNANGKSIASQASYVEDGTLMVPLRDVADALGAETQWDAENKMIGVSLGDDYADFDIGDTQMRIGTREIDMKKAAVIKNDKAYVPVTAFNYGFDLDVKWDEKSGQCSITKSDDEVKGEENTISDSVKADDGTAVLSYEVKYIQLNSDTKSAETINRVLKAEAEKTAADFKNEYAKTQSEYYEESKKDSGLNFRPAVLTSTIKTYTNDIYLSVLNTYCYDLGGAHPTSTRTSLVFKLDNGDEATAAECTGLKDEKAVKNAVLNGWDKEISDEKNYYFEDSTKTLEEEYSKIGFYLDKNGVVFYMPLYEIAPYAAGFPEFEITK
ncbi:MAG: stalk domain-containing protein [Clostridia bacterium]|jgi:hypothetical protein|nr:stalk domain-containing protein [Clostridia bacterium]MCI1999617.1 stalk domain-containing protein [Clostridia bacterium]MCI2014004.1 stalk domain-containing protein [Clostridia bacterium]